MPTAFYEQTGMFVSAQGSSLLFFVCCVHLQLQKDYKNMHVFS
jgi:hypothetical protein